MLARDIELLNESDTEALSEPEERLGPGRNLLRIRLYSEVRHARGDTASNSDWTLLIKKGDRAGVLGRPRRTQAPRRTP